MAGTNDDNTTSSVPAADLLLLGGAVSLIVQHTHCSERAAKKLIEDYLSGRGLGTAPRLRRRYASAEGHRGQFEPNGQRDAFYMADPQRRIFVDYDYEASTVRRRAPRRLSPSWPTQLMGPEPDCTLHFFQLHRGDLEEILQVMGLMPRPSAVPETKPEPPPAAQEPLPEKLLQLPEEPQHEPAKMWRPEEAPKWLAEKFENDPPRDGEGKNKWVERQYPEMQKDFGDKTPWSKLTLRRRMNDLGDQAK
jgi:hypothetical protein